MPSLGGGGSDQAMHVGIVVTLTALWWACAVGVTVVLKVALVSDGSSSVPGAWSFPFPLTLTLLANVGTAIACGLLASLAGRNGLDDGSADVPTATLLRHPTQPPDQGTAFPPSRTMMRASSREALLRDTTRSPDPGAASAAIARGDFAGCPGGGALASCGCWSRRRKRGALAQAPLELEMFAEPELLLAPPEESIVVAGPSAGNSPRQQRSTDHSGLKCHGSPASPGDPGGAGASSSGGPAPGAAAEAGAPLGRLLAGGVGAVLTEQNVALVTMGLIQGLALGAKNEALLLLSVSTRTMIFATNVLVVMLVARLFGLEKLKRGKLGAAGLLAFGGMLQGLASWRRMRLEKSQGAALSDEPFGFALAFLALVLDALRWVLLQAVFAQDGPTSPNSPPACEGAGEGTPHDAEGGSCAASARTSVFKALPRSKLRMVSWVMWTTTPVCLALSALFEPHGLGHASRHPGSALGLVALLTVGVMGINVAEFGIVQWTSAVTFNVLSQLHSIPLVLAGVTCFRERIAPVQVLGFAICLVGALMYSVVKNQEKRMSQVPAGEPEQGGPSVVEVPFTCIRQGDDPLRRQGFA